MEEKSDSVLNRKGEPIYRATVLVKTAAGATATIYSDNGVTPITNPLRTDENGYFSYYAADGVYSWTINYVSADERVITGIQHGPSITISAGSQTATSGTVAFGNSNGISFGMDGSSQITASYTIPSLTAYLTTARASNDAIGLNTALTANGLSVTANSAGLSINVPAYLTTAGLSADSSKYAGINGAITGGSITANTSGVSINLPNYLTTARASTDAVGLNTALTANGVAWTVNSSGISLNVPAFLTTARGSTDAIGLNTAITGNGVSMTANSAGLSLNVPAFLTTARGSTDAIGLNTAGSNVTWTVNSSGLSLDARGYAGTAFAGTNVNATINSGGISLSVNTAANVGATLSHYENMPFLNAQSSSQGGNNTIYMQPFVLPENGSFCRMQKAASNGAIHFIAGAQNSNSMGTRQQTAGTTYSYAIYTQGIGANSTYMSRIFSSSVTMSIGATLSVTAGAGSISMSVTNSQAWGYLSQIGTNGAYTTTSLTASTSNSDLLTSIAAASITNTDFNQYGAGLFNLQIGMATSLSAGNYWMAFAESTASSSTGSTVQNASQVLNSVYGMSGLGWANQAYGFVSASTTQANIGAGSYSATSAGFPATIGFNEVKRVASSMSQWFNMVNYSL